MPTKILLVDDHKMIRDGLRALLEKEHDLKVVGEASDGRSAVRLAQELKPDLVVMDITMPGLNGMTATSQLIAQHPGIKILILSMHADRRFVLETLRAGASGYLLKDSAFEELARAIREVIQGRAYLSPQIAEFVVGDVKRRSETNPHPLLSPREREVLQLVVEGLTTKEIAARLSVSGKTIETHRQQVISKLGVDSIAGLTK